MLDPRRPVDQPSEDDQKEGLFQYSPIVQYNTGGIVTYTKSVPRLSNIYSVPVELESTSLLLGVGLDFFYVRSQPARGFDLIPSDFSYAQLMLICGGLMFAVMYASSAVKTKNLKQKWG
jgi:ER membrane protein complex subunit 1